MITDFSLDWLESRDKEKPFMLMLHHKAPHRRWEPDEKHATLYEDVDIPEPVTFHDTMRTAARRPPKRSCGLTAILASWI